MVAGAAPRRTLARPSVLVIDDDPNIREYLEDVLTGEWCDVTTLADPSHAVERIRHGMFHIILLDLMMPKIYGLDLLAEIRAFDDKIPVIIMDSAPFPATAAAAIRYGGSAYVHHPLTPDEIREALSRILNR